MIHDTWQLAECDGTHSARLARELGVHPVTARLLINRGLGGVDDARTYLHPTLDCLPDPFLLPDMGEAVERIAHALREGQRIAVIGDYDVDGVTSMALLIRFMRMVGTDPLAYIPHRLSEGYGLNRGALEDLRRRGAELVITVDNGIRSVEEVEAARALGLDVIVTDHHEIGRDLPRAHAVIDPKRGESRFPDRELAGCGVAFMLLMALRRTLRERGLLEGAEPNLRRLLDLVAIGTVADIVPLTGLNRLLVKFGLAELACTAKPGLRALMKVSGVQSGGDNALRAGHIAFRIAPRLNAAGRIEDAYPALDCLITDDPARGEDLASRLDRINAARQRLEERVYADVKEMIPSQEDRAGIVVASRDWHAGVVGIVASKVARLTHKPCAVIACDGGVGKGSVRSAAGVDIMQALDMNAPHLMRYGGHTQAGGFTIGEPELAAFGASFHEACARLRHARPVPLTVDAEIAAGQLTEQLVEEIAALEPFGAGNPEPVLIARDIMVLDHAIVGESHLRLNVEHGSARFSAIGFDMAPLASRLNEAPLLAFLPQYNTWNGVTRIQLKLKALLV